MAFLVLNRNTAKQTSKCAQVNRHTGSDLLTSIVRETNENDLQMRHKRCNHGFLVRLEQRCFGQFLSCCLSFGSSA
jgi:hypothetical protein